MKWSLFSPLAFFAPLLCTVTYLIFLLIANLSKSQILESLGAVVEGVRPVSITDRDHLVNIAQRRALEENETASKHREADQMNGKPLEQTIDYYTTGEEKQSLDLPHNCKGRFFSDNFENLPNFWAHYESTGPKTFGYPIMWKRCALLTGPTLQLFIKCKSSLKEKTRDTMLCMAKWTYQPKFPLLLSD